jgi:hypothetical protein
MTTLKLRTKVRSVRMLVKSSRKTSLNDASRSTIIASELIVVHSLKQKIFKHSSKEMTVKLGLMV